MNDGLFVHIRKNTILDRPLEVVHLNLSLEQPALIQPSSLLILDQGARAQIIERFISTGESLYFHNGISEILLEDHARLSHLRLQEESLQAYHLHRSLLSQGTGSHYNNTSISSGGQWARHDLQVRFRGQNAECTTHGLYLVGDKQLADQHLDVRHTTAMNTSHHTHKGILYGNGRAVFDGRILVNQDAQKTDANLSNHNLLLSRHAEVDTKPQLEIYADDVKCSHGTTVGQLEPDQLYYLRSRGISQTKAMQMLCTGFAGEILESIELQPVREHVEHRVHAVLAHIDHTMNGDKDD
jgi:Fe-S cluster assembly protein SufD